jgi:hypothetical protein
MKGYDSSRFCDARKRSKRGRRERSKVREGREMGGAVQCW